MTKVNSCFPSSFASSVGTTFQATKKKIARSAQSIPTALNSLKKQAKTASTGVSNFFKQSTNNSSGNYGNKFNITFDSSINRYKTTFNLPPYTTLYFKENGKTCQCSNNTSSSKEGTLTTGTSPSDFSTGPLNSFNTHAQGPHTQTNNNYHSSFHQNFQQANPAGPHYQPQQGSTYFYTGLSNLFNIRGQGYSRTNNAGTSRAQNTYAFNSYRPQQGSTYIFAVPLNLFNIRGQGYSQANPAGTSHAQNTYAFNSYRPQQHPGASSTHASTSGSNIHNNASTFITHGTIPDTDISIETSPVHHSIYKYKSTFTLPPGGVVYQQQLDETWKPIRNESEQNKNIEILHPTAEHGLVGEFPEMKSLDVKNGDSAEVIRKKQRVLLREYHSDKLQQKGKSEAEIKKATEEFTKVKNNYKVVMDTLHPDAPK